MSGYEGHKLKEVFLIVWSKLLTRDSCIIPLSSLFELFDWCGKALYAKPRVEAKQSNTSELKGRVHRSWNNVQQMTSGPSSTNNVREQTARPSESTEHAGRRSSEAET